MRTIASSRSLSKFAGLSLALALVAVPLTSAAPSLGLLSTAHADPTPPEVGAAPTLTPKDGAYLAGTQKVASTPTAAEDDVTSLAVDGEELDAETTYGDSMLTFEVADNSIEARYGSKLVINGEHSIDLGDHVSETVREPIPNTWLKTGENTVELKVGAIETSCGMNYDDYDLSNVRLELLGESANGEENEWNYSLGDGSCGTNTARVKEASLSFFITGDPKASTGLETELDTTELDNGSHEITATTLTGESVTHTVTVNNAPAGAPDITPQDGHLTRGTQQVFANLPVGGDTSVDTLTVDGRALPTTPTLGSGDATFTFTVGTNSIEARYKNYLTVNGIPVDVGGDWVSQAVPLVIPNEWLQPGENVIRFVTGTYPGTCGDNRDDFTISSISLAPATGTATAVGVQPKYDLGDGNCGSSTRPREAVLKFQIDGAAAQGVRADLDTTTVDDGTHTVRATSSTGEAATRTLVTDNTAPEITGSTPEAGKKITTSVPLSLELSDDSGVLGDPAVTLDGKPVAAGDLVGPGLSAGEHTIALTATDSLGNKADRTVVFTSAGIPDDAKDLSPTSGDNDLGTTVDLKARVAEPDGGEVNATFSAAEILTPRSGWQGEAPQVPTTLKVPGEKNVGDTRVLEPGNNGALDSVASGDVSYQRFDVQVNSTREAPVLRWEGVTDPTRVVTLRAWNLLTRTWDPLDSARGAVDGNTLLNAGVGRQYVDGKTVHVMVTGEDPFADDLDATDRTGFDDPSTYDFSMVHYTDTQYLSEGAVEQETAEERAVWSKAYGDVARWIRDNADARKIAYVAHTGDIIENNIRPPATEEMEQQVVGEFEVSSEHQKVLDDAGVANGVIAGNHDNQSGREDGPEAIYNQYYGPGRYEESATRWKNGSYGGPWKAGDNQNHFDLFSAGGQDFVVVGLSYGVTREEAEWADAVFKRYADRNAILLSHDYLKPSTKPDGRDGTFSAPDGSLLYNTLVLDNPNVFLILAGHEHGVATNVKPDVGVVGNNVVELLADYQFYETPASMLGLDEIGGYQPDQGLRFGASYFRMLQFDVDRGEMSVDTYSPLLDDFGATEFDPLKRYDGREDTMVLPVELGSRTTSFSTESLGLYSPTKVVGEVTVPSGQVASVTWQGLRPDTAYAWIVTSTSSGGGVNTSRPQVFATADAKGRPSKALAGLEFLAE
ncbi:metallophosphoesterase [Nocardioides sp. Root151]|uniref:metallophosphoesterase n=1 Tax=Nocardioides sp. Root151 TaxID=1736475 RepID=UPI00070264CC|nr:metallophosphoesterase [Nocardioides sp. Root151]KQZ67130.1 hypothetical protein ASD66_19255 [Nocardioides sp. Root151]